MRELVHWIKKKKKCRYCEKKKNLLANPDLTLILISHHLSDERKAQFDHVYELSPVSAVT